MQLKNFLLILAPLILPAIFFAQEQENPCLNGDRMQKKLYEIAKKFMQEEGSKTNLRKNGKKRLIFMQKFLGLSEEEQKKKIEKWLAIGSRRRLLRDCNCLVNAFKNKRFDEEIFECSNGIRKNGEQWGYKNEILFFTCGELFCEEIDKIAMQKYMKELKIKEFFNQLKKEEAQKFVKRQQELQELREKALDEYV